MTETTRFPNAPITEALLDIQDDLPEHVDLPHPATCPTFDKGPSIHPEMRKCFGKAMFNSLKGT